MQKERRKLKQHLLKEFFDYCSTGFLIRKKKTTAKTKVGARVGSNSHKGYKKFNFLGEVVYLHRAIFVWHHGKNPHSVDHINRNPSDNRIENLRGVTHQRNLCNLGISKVNTSGVRGLFFDKRDSCFYGQVVFKGKVHTTKRSKDRSEVIEAIQAKREMLYERTTL